MPDTEVRLEDLLLPEDVKPDGTTDVSAALLRAPEGAMVVVGSTPATRSIVSSSWIVPPHIRGLIGDLSR